ncbi:MAG: hypothetical protein ACRD5W_13800, partial [Candidatus Acidiferrales bacterium]
GEVSALVDARDSFDPHSAQAAGVMLHRLLWARCKNIEQAFRAAEWLLTGGGFGVVALDLGEIAPQTVHRVPLHVWFRFRRAVEHTPTVLVVLEQQPHASTCASLVLELRAEGSRWPAAASAASTHAKLFSEKEVRTAIVRSRHGTFVKQPYRVAQSDRAAESCCASFAVSLD